MIVIFIVCIALICLEKNELESHKRAFGNKDFCGVVMPSGDTKILEFNQQEKSDKTSSIIYADPESLIKRIDEKNNFNKFPH